MDNVTMPSQASVEVEIDAKPIQDIVEPEVQRLIERWYESEAHKPSNRMRDFSVVKMLSDENIREFAMALTQISVQAVMWYLTSPKRERDGEVVHIVDLLHNLCMHGYLDFSNVHMAPYMQMETMKWRVRYEIRLPNGFLYDKLVENLFETLAELWDRTQKWYQLYGQQWLDEDGKPPVNI